MIVQQLENGGAGTISIQMQDPLHLHLKHRVKGNVRKTSLRKTKMNTRRLLMITKSFKNYFFTLSTSFLMLF